MFGVLHWPLNASRGLVSISWASCYYNFEICSNLTNVANSLCNECFTTTYTTINCSSYLTCECKNGVTSRNCRQNVKAWAKTTRELYWRYVSIQPRTPPKGTRFQGSLPTFLGLLSTPKLFDLERHNLSR